MIFNYIEKAYYINLDYRVDRKELFEKRVQELGIPVERFPAIIMNEDDVQNPHGDPRWHNKVSNYFTHLAVVKKAQEEGYNNVWVFEDDCTFINDFNNQAQKCIDDLKGVDWDMFYFGGEPNAKTEYYTENIVKTRGIYGAHSYLVNSIFYDKILKMNVISPIDIHYLNYDCHQKNYYLSRKILCNQDGESYSDIWGQTLFRDDIYQNAYNLYVS